MEMNIRKNDLLLCELHYPFIHGKTIDSDPFIESHYLLIENLEVDPFLLQEENNIRYLNRRYRLLSIHGYIAKDPHPTIRNFENIVTREDYIKPEIGQCIELVTQEYIVIIKTCWLKIVQRVWKNIFKQRQKILFNPRFLYECEIGKSSINRIPSIHGMLSFLKVKNNKK